jgi:hypothetical protein
LGSDDARLVAIREDYPSLRGQVAELGRIAQAAAEHGARIRVTFEL